jgi:hypothetical protein
MLGGGDMSVWRMFVPSTDGTCPDWVKTAAAVCACWAGEIGAGIDAMGAVVDIGGDIGCAIGGDIGCAIGGAIGCDMMGDIMGIWGAGITGLWSSDSRRRSSGPRSRTRSMMGPMLRDARSGAPGACATLRDERSGMTGTGTAENGPGAVTGPAGTGVPVSTGGNPEAGRRDCAGASPGLSSGASGVAMRGASRRIPAGMVRSLST